jgi:hypothetical protein
MLGTSNQSIIHNNISSIINLFGTNLWITILNKVSRANKHFLFWEKGDSTSVKKYFSRRLGTRRKDS